MIKLAKPGRLAPISAVVVFALILSVLSLIAIAAISKLAFLAAWCSLNIWVISVAIFTRTMKKSSGKFMGIQGLLFGLAVWLLFMLAAFHVTPDMAKPSHSQSFVFLILGFAIPLLAARLAGAVTKRFVWSSFDAGWPRDRASAIQEPII